MNISCCPHIPFVIHVFHPIIVFQIKFWKFSIPLSFKVSIVIVTQHQNSKTSNKGLIANVTLCISIQMPCTKSVMSSCKHFLYGISHCQVSISYNISGHFSFHDLQKLLKEPDICLFNLIWNNYSSKPNSFIMIVDTRKNNYKKFMLVFSVSRIKTK